MTATVRQPRDLLNFHSNAASEGTQSRGLSSWVCKEANDKAVSEMYTRRFLLGSF